MKLIFHNSTEKKIRIPHYFIVTKYNFKPLKPHGNT